MRQLIGAIRLQRLGKFIPQVPNWWYISDKYRRKKSFLTKIQNPNFIEMERTEYSEYFRVPA